MDIIKKVKKFFNIRQSDPITEAFVNEMSKDAISEFNAMIAFVVVPNLVSQYNQKNISFSAITDKNSYKKYASSSMDKFKISKVELKQDVAELIVMTLPSNKKFSEVEALVIAHYISAKKAVVYSMEYSLENQFAICKPSVNGHENMGIFINNEKEFASEVIKQVLLDIEKNESEKAINEPPEETTTERFARKLAEQKKAFDKIPSEIENYITNPLLLELEGMDKLNDISASIAEHADYMISLLSDLPNVSEEGKLECQIVLASTLVTQYDKFVLGRSIASKSSIIDSFRIEQKIDYYRTLFIGFTTCSNPLNEWTLMEFAGLKGKMQIGNLVKPDSYGCLKRAVFTNANGERLMCRFVMLTSDQQNPKYVQEHKHELIVRQYSEDDYVIVPSIFDNYGRSSYYDILAYWIFCNPLAYDDVFNVHKFHLELEKQGISPNVSKGIIERAYIESKNKLHESLIELPF